MSDSAKRSLEDIERGSEQLEGILTENREPIKELVQSLMDGGARVAPAMLKIEKILQSVDGMLLELRPKLKSGLSHARTAMANFSDVTEDLKTAPWKLINKPSDEEDSSGPPSKVDPGASYGHQSKNKPFFGFKAVIAMDADSGIITKATATTGEEHDSQHCDSPTHDHRSYHLIKCDLRATHFQPHIKTLNNP